MCDPATIMMGGSALLSFMGSQNAAVESASAGRYNKRIAEERAEMIKKQSVMEAQKIQAAALRFRGKQIATQAAAGVVVGDGSAQTMVDETTRLAEQDIYITLYNGERGEFFAMEEGRLAEMMGDAQSDAYEAQGGATLLSSVGSMASSRNSYQVAKS